MTTSSRHPEEKNIFVIGLDDSNEEVLRRIPGAGRYRFHALLSPEELQHGEIPIVELVEKAEAHLDAFDGQIDAIVSYWDFPSSTMVAMLCEKYGLPGVSLEAVLKCEHKYWSRLEQAKVIDEVPSFGIVDLDEDDPRPPEGVDYPMWLKPVKSFSSELAFHVADADEFDKAVAEIRAGVDRVGKPFERVLATVDLPEEVANAGGAACLAEGELNGVQAATEGYVYKGQVTVYGVLDSINYPDSTSFLRHQYPSQLPVDAVERMKEISVRVMEQIGFDNATFSIEFFCHPESGQACLLEINPRHSQSHAELFEYVDGVANHQIMVRLGLGQDPGARRNRGDYRIAGKWYYRRFSDALVTRVPTRAEIADLEAEIPGVKIELVAEKDVRLSDLPEQDSYSYELAHIFVAAQTEREMESKYRRCTEALRFDFEEG
ncbi:ATP-grasp domain-containing protein [Amycolatopsis keratiniphila]|uniref:ATP-grasp domain-containing protein n=1 Tax=Amycolatopsis keratiniphila TaxID=129921 RepID=R4ST77_9PSEU|nr:ATP-grasp domain-containing protein [Amycolatopsis keratiniphila]AGM05785.1 hypothetical protein AORI_3200 [Amycolatopsis keratiniphila]